MFTEELSGKMADKSRSPFPSHEANGGAELMRRRSVDRGISVFENDLQ